MLFANKAAWEAAVAREIDARLAEQRTENEALVVELYKQLQDELAQRDRASTMRQHQESCYADMLSAHPKLTAEPAFVQAVYNEIYDDIKHLPINVAYERLGEVAQARFDNLRGEAPSAPAPTAPRATPRAPALLSSGRRGAPAATQPPARQTVSDVILRNQARLLGTGGA